MRNLENCSTKAIRFRLSGMFPGVRIPEYFVKLFNLIILDKLQYQKETFGSKHVSAFILKKCHFTGPISTIRGLCRRWSVKCSRCSPRLELSSLLLLYFVDFFLFWIFRWIIAFIHFRCVCDRKFIRSSNPANFV
jgi:hypothetical protein